MDFNNLSDNELKTQFPGLYKQMSELVAQMIQGKSPDELLKALETMQNATISGGDIFNASGDLIGSIKSQRDEDFDVDSINDELLQELFTGIGVDGNGEVRRHEGTKSQVKSIAESLFKNND